MHESPTLLGLEMVVDDLDRALALLVDVLGLELVSRAPSELVEGETAVIDCGSVAITLLAPAAHGPGPVLGNRDPRVSQLVFGVPGAESVERLQHEMAESGLAIAPAGSAGFFATPESMVGALGMPTAVVVVPAPGQA
jgi:catechol 2,3-dioxygenase-like lactoylglutathione lyase family enzyme